MLAQGAVAALRQSGDASPAQPVAAARFFAENIAVQAASLATTVTEGAQSVTGASFPES
jgi:hypothetical protein